jgi:hypothetical protein
MGWWQGQTGGLFYSVSPFTVGGGPQLLPGGTYFVNIRNIDILGNPTCTTSTCNLVIQHKAPF